MSKLASCFVCAVLVLHAAAAPVINEIMFHPPGAPAENVAEEWVEIFNPDVTPANVAGWKLSKGVGFTIPAATTIPAGGYLVIAANVGAFNAAHPGYAGAVVGGWTGQLSNSGEQLQLDNAAGVKICDVSYADAGDWALRGRGALSFSHKGWDWFSEAAGGGKTLELRNRALGLGSGQNWGVSTAAGGTPGAVNTLVSTNIAPLIKDAKHRPEIPRSTDPVIVSCNLEDEVPGATAVLSWRLDGGSFATLPMTDTDGDGDVEATIPAQANLAVIEWFITAADGTNPRTWPAPARTSDIGVLPETFDQVTNALVQVDNAYDPNATFRTAVDNPIYRLVMTAAERTELVTLGTTSGQEQSEALMNGTFISHDGTGVKLRYLCGLRNRGQGSALGPPNNYHVAFRSDDLWNGRASVAINCRYGYAQALGQALMARAGLATQDGAVVKVRVNGADLAQAGALMYGRYVRLEGRGRDWAEHHYPLDAEGNFYRLDDHDTGGTNPPGDLGSGEFRYEGTDLNAYSDTYIKETNKDENDFSDLINLVKVVSAPVTGGTVAQPAIADAAYPAALAAVLDIDEAFRFFAADALLGNMEGGLQSGRGDDASLYRGVLDPRFRFVPHDLDTIFDIGDTLNGATRSIFSYDGGTALGTGVLGLTRLFTHPQLVPRYYAAVLDGLNTWFNSATVDPFVDQLLTGWVPTTDGVAANRSITDIKAYVTARRANVLAAIQQNYALSVTTAAANTAEGYKQTVDGVATFSGTFNVAKTYSITVNGVPVSTMNQRTRGALTAGTWSLAVAAGGGGVLSPGLNKVVVNFWDAPGGTGNVVQSLTADVFYNTGAGTSIAGTLSAGSLRLTAPSSYVPGKPFLARAELLDGAGNVNRAAWDTTVTLSASVGGITLPAVQLYNGEGSALITAGGSGGGGTTQLIIPGGTLALPNASAPDWRMLDTGAEPAATWKSDQAFVDSAWTLGKLQAGAGDGDERTALNNVSGSAVNTRRAFYFRKVFNVTDPAAFTQLLIKAVVDDGAVFYLNGTEVYRDNMAAGTPTLTTPASTNRSGTAETQIRTFDITAFLNLLVTGNNLLAAEVHNFSDAAPTYSVDLSFDCALDGVAPSTDPGAFTLTATGGGFTAQKALTSLGTSPAYTVATGAIAANTTWSGAVHVTGDVTVNTGVTLTIAAGTNIFIDGDATAGSTAGKRIIVNGALVANGTQANPVNISAFLATDRWGGLSFGNAAPSTLNYTLLSYAGHTTGVGHTGRGPMVRLATTNLSLLDSVLADGPAKAIYSSGTCNLVIQRSMIERMITGPELEDGISLLIEDSDIHRILPDYRESNSNVPDDEDCLYVHNSTGRSVIIRRSVFARCGDDVFDCLGGPITVEDSILREGWDKGMSLLNNDLTISRTQIVKCDKAIVPKSQAADTRTVTATNCTIISENHDTTLAPWGYSIPPTSPDADSPSTGFYTQNKAGQSNAGATLAINAKNCIVIAQSPVLVDAPYSAVNTVVTYSDLALIDYSAFAWPGTGNITANPLFTDAANGNYRLTSASPARDTGDPATFDPDLTRADMGALPYAASAAAGTITWTAAGGPYHVTANTTVPAGLTLVIQPGTHVYFDQNKRLTVNGRLLAQGTAGQRIVFSHVPNTVAAGDCDPIKNGVQTGPAKWGGIRIVDALAQESVVANADFINAQGTSPVDLTESDQENWGGLGAIRSWVWVDGCTWTGSHLRWCYGRCAKLTVTRCTFGDMFAAGEAPPADFISGSDNKQEPLKVEYKSTDSALTGNANFVGGFPIGGWFRVYFNDFYGNKGHNDVFDGDGGRVGTSFPLDCRYNWFHGLTGDEHMDLKGDALIANNIIEHGTKDQYTSDTGYSNAISTDGAGAGTTNMVARNLVFDMDHLINCKLQVAAIVEHNTIANMHADFHYSAGSPYFIEQDVKCSVVNMLVYNDAGGAPPHGDGCYLGYNIISGVPRLVSDADTVQTSTNTINHSFTTKIEFNQNLCDQITDPSIGFNHAGTIFASAFGTNLAGAPLFVNSAAKDYTPKAESPARGIGPVGLDLGWTIPEWAYLAGGPSGTTSDPAANFTVGGPGLIAFKWRLDGGAWSAPVTIGTGGVFDRLNPTVRTGPIALSGLAAGAHTLEVLGMDFAGNWQDADPAKTYTGQAQFTPTARTWTVDAAFVAVRLSEILADSATLADTVEVQNISGAAVSLVGWSLTDDPLVPNKLPLTGSLAAGGFATFTGVALTLDTDGDTVYLYQGATLRDAVTFGQQIADKTIGRNVTGAWALCAPTLGAANTPVAVGDPSTVRISEWLASGDVLYSSDWIELQNTNTAPVVLAGLRVTDNRVGDASAYTFPALSFIAGGGYVRLVADGGTAPGHLPFNLDAEYEVLSLLTVAGALQDTVSFYPQTTDYSMGRDGAGALTFYELPTRGFLNGVTDPAYANALALLRGLRITEIMYNPLGGTEYEYVELRNVGASSFDLVGVKFVNGIDFTFPTTVLAPGQNVLVVRNLAKFRNRYGTGPSVAGAYIGSLDNSGEKLSLQLPPPFDANVLTFSYSDTWQPTTDGPGRSLIVANPLLKAALWGDKDTWAASTTNGGDPNGAGVPPLGLYADWSVVNGVLTATADGDKDGVAGLVEFGLGMNPASATGGDGAAGLPGVALGGTGRVQLRFLVPTNADATQVHGMPELTYTVLASGDLVTWTPIATKTFPTTWTGSATATIGTPAGGFTPVTVEDVVSGAPRFLRLQVTWTP